MTTLALPLANVARLRHRVRALSENRPAVYRMLDPTRRVIYVGKARQLRVRLLSYFRAREPDKQARILQASADIEWDYKPSDFAAHLDELRQIKRHRPPFNVSMNRNRRVAFLKLFSGAAPKFAVGLSVSDGAVRHYGPFPSTSRLKDAVRVLNDLLGLRDCALDTAIAFAEQGDLFQSRRRAGCLRHELGTCAGPCAGFVTEAAYRRQVETAVAFIEGRAVAPLDRVVEAMLGASRDQAFERAQWWRARFEALTWLLGACVRAHQAVNALTFVYLDPGAHGDDRVYLLRRGTVRAAAPVPRTPIEREAFRAVVTAHKSVAAQHGPLPPEDIDEILLVMRWFRKHPGALRRTLALEQWLAHQDDVA